MRTLLIVGSLLLAGVLATSCGGDSGQKVIEEGKTKPGGQPPAPEIKPLSIKTSLFDGPTPTSELKPWSGGPGEVRLYFLVTNRAISNTPLSANGGFEVNLTQAIPDADLGSGLFSDDFKNLCFNGTPVTFASSNPESRSAVAQFASKTPLQTRGIESFLPPLVFSDPKGYVARLGLVVYSNAATVVSARQSCLRDGKPLQVDADVSLVKGWNTVLESLEFINNPDGSLTLKSLTLRNAPLPEQWAILYLPSPGTPDPVIP